MKPREFFDLVAKLRDAEKGYEKLNSPGALVEAARLRKILDEEIKRVRTILKNR